MNLLKSLMFVAVLSGSLFASGFGVKAQFVANDIGPGLGMGFLGKIDLTDFFMLYPNVDFWWSHHRYDRYWAGDHWAYYDYGYNAYEVAVNFDGAFKFPLGPVQPYLGLGLAAPVITFDDYEPRSNSNRSYSHESQKTEAQKAEEEKTKQLRYQWKIDSLKHEENH